MAKESRPNPWVRPVMRRAAMGAGLWLAAAAAVADSASGELALGARTGPVSVKPQHAYLLVGPDFDGKPIRQLVLSEKDLAATIQGCDRLGCVSGALDSGVTVDFDAGPRLNYWLVANGQRVQHSDTARPDTMKLDENSAQRLAGQWTLSGGVGATGSVRFDASLAKRFGKN
ncbi:hypothetical protein [Ottowia sp.]|uniref:hypothetical protein n=1 Tax=Ottowia sp. TaxID=1898956 RepID=UPI001D2CF044|nr:hypothetical protein [Ottowia sp.]MCB2035081.1 hypothetical protein [Ottowia sp.]MCP5256399.1 hypothetical protein [Burkholderiaceae bacterium]HRW72194.1 hypothetical protein [Ottowia sp.]